MKRNAYLANRDAIMFAGYQKQLDFTLQMGLDAAMMAANKVLHLGKGRAKEFEQEYKKAINDIANLIVMDSKDDDELVYSKEKHDQTIKAIVGEENFEPFDVRYSLRIRKENK